MAGDVVDFGSASIQSMNLDLAILSTLHKTASEFLHRCRRMHGRTERIMVGMFNDQRQE